MRTLVATPEVQGQSLFASKGHVYMWLIHVGATGFFIAKNAFIINNPVQKLSFQKIIDLPPPHHPGKQGLNPLHHRPADLPGLDQVHHGRLRIVCDFVRDIEASLLHQLRWVILKFVHCFHHRHFRRV